MWKRIGRGIEKNWSEFRGIALRKYPAFILSDRVSHLVDIPVFVFHDVTAAVLEPMLQFLTDNKYATVTADEYAERQVRRQRGREREVLLTFDDGLKSLYSVAYPTLKNYGLKAVAYIVPGMTPECDESRLCSWKEIEEMHNSGILDIQSHSMYHHSIAISKRLVEFVRPNLRLSFLDSDLAPLIRRDSDNGPQDAAYGTPIYNWGSRFGAVPAFHENPSVMVACKAYVDDNGGAAFFNSPGWRRCLKRVWTHARNRAPEARFETTVEQREAILQDFLNSKREIEARLTKKTVRHFCYPWFRGSPLAVQLSAGAGYVTNAWGSLLPNFIRGTRTPIAVPRLSSLYLWRLPGQNRKSMSEILRLRLTALARIRCPA